MAGARDVIRDDIDNRMRLFSDCREDWPLLAWLAVLEDDNDVVRVSHGKGVEFQKDWYCEAAWPGSFEAGDFDQTDLVVGTGARIRDDTLIFVSSGSTVDRLQYFESSGMTYVSNSLACLLAEIDADPLLTYDRYYADFYSVVRGLEDYKKAIDTTRGEVKLVYFHNLSWDAGHLSIVEKPNGQRKFRDFQSYRDFLRVSLVALNANMAAEARRFAFTQLATASTGYDSSMVMALAVESGCAEAMCFDEASDGASDAGKEIAETLGVTYAVVPISRWRDVALSEVPFICANGMGEEVRFKGAEDLLKGRVLMTGYHGDKVWAMRTNDVSPAIVRGDPSGLGLTEYRLRAGFLHCALPFWGVRQIEQIQAISRSEEMRPWSIGGDYDRPICRRTVEESGVRRAAFGMIKKQGSTFLYNDRSMLSDSSLSDYQDWLSRHKSGWWHSGKIPPNTNTMIDHWLFDAKQTMSPVVRKLPLIWHLDRWLCSPNRSRRFLFQWAMDHAKEVYAGRPSERPAESQNAEISSIAQARIGQNLAKLCRKK